MMEEIARKKRLEHEEPLKLTDFVKNATDNSFIMKFMKELRNRMHVHEINLKSLHKQYKQPKTEQELKDKFTK